jgi:hypothetical protein
MQDAERGFFFFIHTFFASSWMPVMIVESMLCENKSKTLRVLGWYSGLFLLLNRFRWTWIAWTEGKFH